MRKLSLLVICAFVLSSNILLCKTGIIKDSKLQQFKTYTFILENGDRISGELVEFISGGEDGEAVKVKTEIGKATIYEYQIHSVYEVQDNTRSRDRMLLMPTAYPIENNHYLSIEELLMASGGFGLFDFISVSAAHTFIPTKKISGQAAYVNAKFTAINIDFDEDIKNFAIAPGINYLNLGGNNEMWHLFVALSINFGTTTVSSNVFYKAKGGDYYKYRIDDNSWDFAYQNGGVGISLGIDKELSKRGARLFVELINSDMTNKKKTGIATGLRFGNETFSSDLGLFLIGSVPIPIMKFSWYPF
jgi:hypothetical protein